MDLEGLPGYGTYRRWQRPKNEQHFSDAFVDKTYVEQIEGYGLRSSFTTETDFLRTAETEVDSIRHAYTTALAYKTFGNRVLTILNDGEVRQATKDGQWESHVADIWNNEKAAEIVDNLRGELGREPTSDEIFEKVLEELIDGRLWVVRQVGKEGWKERAVKELHEARTERAIKEMFQSKDGPKGIRDDRPYKGPSDNFRNGNSRPGSDLGNRLIA